MWYWLVCELEVDPRPEGVLGSAERAAESKCGLSCPTGGLE